MICAFDNRVLAKAMAEHLPVMLREVIDLLSPSPGHCLLDCTFGGGGHARKYLQTLDARVVALDCDPDAITRGRDMVEFSEGRLLLYHRNFRDVADLKESDFDGALLDLGLSSYQLDEPDRGFSFRGHARPDMRMDPGVGRSAEDFLESAPHGELARAIRDYGEERRWRSVVHAILRARGSGLLSDTESLAEVIASAVRRPRGGRYRRHPATRAFQGIRMAVNAEIENLMTTLPGIFTKLGSGGILVAISFHSLEDRVVKRFMRRIAGLPEDAGDGTPKQLRECRGELLCRRPMRPTREEVELNPRCRSARLRALKKW